jgi:hypothetical protein
MLMSLVHNERIKLTAAAIDRASTSMFVVGFLGPVVATFYTDGETSPVHAVSLVAGGGICVIISVLLHFVARSVLKGLKT